MHLVPWRYCGVCLHSSRCTLGQWFSNFFRSRRAIVRREKASRASVRVLSKTRIISPSIERRAFDCATKIKELFARQKTKIRKINFFSRNRDNATSRIFTRCKVNLLRHKRVFFENHCSRHYGEYSMRL